MNTQMLKILLLPLMLYLTACAGMSVGGNFGIATSNQRDMKSLITNANSNNAGLSTATLGNAWEGNLMLTYRLSGMNALQFRPGFFYQAEEGRASNGDKFEYSAVGWTLFPVLRTYLLEDSAIKLFANFGVGWGILYGEVKEAADTIEFSGHNLGYLVGLGVEFCFFSSSHCMNIEGNIRQLGIERNIADASSGTWSGGGSIDSSATKGSEVEIGNRDLGTNMSGVVGLLGYIYYFK